MYCRVLACDFDGTVGSEGGIAPEVAAALGRARALGIQTLLVTGRVLEDLQSVCADLSFFDAVVAENGAIVWFPRGGRTIELGVPPPDEFFGELRARGIPFHAGRVIVGTWDRHADAVLSLIRRSGIDGQLIFNREAMMLLPSGINKAVGVRRALEEVGRSARNLIAFGDAENDLPLLTLAEIGVAARGSVAGVLQRADDRLSHPGGAGVAHYVHRLIEQGGVASTPARHRLVLGRDDTGAAVTMPGSGVNVMISGDPRAGKSWLAGLIAEQLHERGYRLCIIDPEGDHVSLSERPRMLLLGLEVALPDPSVLPHLLRDEPLSLILNLAALPQDRQTAYIDAVLAQLEAARAVTGFPHWILIDEAHYFFHEGAPMCRHLDSRTGNFILVTHRPSCLADAAYDTLGRHLVTQTTVEDERYVITGLLQTHGPSELVPAEALAGIEVPNAALLTRDPTAPGWQIFRPGPRVTSHVHHARKYADTQLPTEKVFRFLRTDGATPVVASNVREFHAALRAVSAASIRHHLVGGDFSSWAQNVLGDARLAHGLRKLERTVLAGGAAKREELLALIEHEYLV